VAIFTTNVDAENQTLINHKCVCGALNRHFCQTRVTSWRSVVCVVKVRSDKGFAVIVRLVFWFLGVGCAVAVLKIFEGVEILKNHFSWAGEVEALLQTLDCALGL